MKGLDKQIRQILSDFDNTGRGLGDWNEITQESVEKIKRLSSQAVQEALAKQKAELLEKLTNNNYVDAVGNIVINDGKSALVILVDDIKAIFEEK